MTHASFSETPGTPVTAALARWGVPYRVFQHPGPVHSLEQAARERGQTPDQVIRSILFRVNEGEYVMALMAGEQQVSWKVLRRVLGVSRVTMAAAEEVLAQTGAPPGAVSPFALPRPLRLFIDRGVLAPEEVSIGSGQRGVTVILSRAALQTALERAQQAGELTGTTLEILDLTAAGE